MNVEVLLLFTKQLSHYPEEWLHSANALDHQPIKERTEMGEGAWPHPVLLSRDPTGFLNEIALITGDLEFLIPDGHAWLTSWTLRGLNTPGGEPQFQHLIIVATTVSTENVLLSEKDRVTTHQAWVFTNKNTNVTQVLWALLIKLFRKAGEHCS